MDYDLDSLRLAICRLFIDNLREFCNPQSDGGLYGDSLLPVGGLPSEQDLQIESLERRLKQQQLESEQDGKWLAEEEINLKKRLSIPTSLSDSDSADGRSSSSPPWKYSGSLDRSRTQNSDERVVVATVSINFKKSLYVHRFDFLIDLSVC